MSGHDLRDHSSALPSQAPVVPADLALMLDLLGQAPVMFHRCFVPVCGSIHSALWLSWAMSRRAQVLAQQAGPVVPGAGTTELVWLASSREDCEEGTALTRHQQDAARRELRDRGIVLERRRQTTMIAIDTRRLGQLLLEQSTADWAKVCDNRPPAEPASARTAEAHG